MFQRHGSRLHHGEGRGALLDLGLGYLQLLIHLGVGIVLELHLILKVFLLGTVGLQDKVLVGVGVGGVLLPRRHIFLLRLHEKLLHIGQVIAGFLRAVLGYEGLQAVLDRVGHHCRDDRVLVGHLNGDDTGLLVYRAVDALAYLVGYVVLHLAEMKRVHLRAVAREGHIVGLQLRNNVVQQTGRKCVPGFLGVVQQIVVVVGGHTAVFRGHLNGKQTHDEVVRSYQVGIQLWIDGIAAAAEVHVHTHHRGDGGYVGGEAVAGGRLGSEHHRCLVLLGRAEGHGQTQNGCYAEKYGHHQLVFADDFQQFDEVDHNFFAFSFFHICSVFLTYRFFSTRRL